MPTTPSRLLIQTLEVRDTLRPEERDALSSIQWQRKSCPAGSEIVANGSRPFQCCLIVEGVSGRAHMLREGKQQISAVHFAGDFVDLHSLTLKVMDHSVIALTECEVALVEHKALERLSQEMPHLTRLLWLLTTIDAATARAWIVSLGRRSSESWLAHLLCEMSVRLGIVGLTDGASFALPVNQSVLADILGLSMVHTNRTLQSLRGDGLFEWRQGVLTILDWDGLARLAEFDPTYLSVMNEPR